MVPEHGATERPKSKKGRLLKPQELGEKEKLLAGLRGQLKKNGATPKELETVRLVPKWRFKYEKKDDKLPTLQGRWTKEEIDILKEMRRDHVHPRVIADRLGRKVPAVVQKIAIFSDYFRECNEASRYEGPHSLPPELERSLLRSRLQNIWEGLMKTQLTKKWDEVLRTDDPSHWQSMILEKISGEVVPILASIQPPHLARFESLSWSDTTSAGVYAWILKPKKGSFHFDNECFVYVGSATQYNKGLRDRKDQLSVRPYRDDSSVMDYIEHHRLDPRGQLVTLLEAPFADNTNEEIERVRTLVVLARAVLVIWLGAVWKESRKAITGIVPWDIESISYSGLAGHNGLFRNIRTPKSPGNSE